MNDELRFDPDDPRLTAFALGELTGEEHARFAALVERDEDARKFVNEVNASAMQLSADLAVEARATTKPTRRRKRPVAIGAIAAVAAVAVGTTLFVKSLDGTTSRGHGSINELTAYESRNRLSSAAAPGRAAISDELRRQLVANGYQSSGTYRGPTDCIPPSEGPGPGTGGAAQPELNIEGISTVGANSNVRLTDSRDHNTERYASIVENAFRRAADESLSTFSIDVDTASYANCRRFLNAGQLPPPAAVRLEEFVNAFTYSYPEPDAGQPFSVTTEVASCPWAPTHRLVRIGLKGKSIDMRNRPAANLVFLIDVSGSMNSPDKLPLLKSALRLLVEQVEEKDTISMVVYAGSSGLVLPPTSGANKTALADAIDRLEAGGSTNGGAGIDLAYKVAVESMSKGGINRVILATDGDFNVGVTDEGSLVKLIEEKRESGVFLSVLGFGTGNLNDAGMEKLADKGNGQYSYIDSEKEARRVLVEQAGGTLVTIAKDVKIQVEFNPAEVEAWRQLGYENRALAAQDFNDDKKDAGEIGAGIAVTALYEIVPRGVPVPQISGVDPKRYTQPAQPSGTAFGGELMFVKLRYKDPDGSESRLIETPVKDGRGEWGAASEDFRFATAVAQFALLLEKSAYAPDASFLNAQAIAAEARGADARGEREEFVNLVRTAQELSAQSK